MTAHARDGTSQAARVLPELDPGYAPVDERTSADLLAFAKAYAGELKYFPPHDPDTADGDWRGFIRDHGASPRPHFALFLAFLELLGHARAQLNTLTRRHLEFFYGEVLGMVRKRAAPDRVHVLVDLEPRAAGLRLPAGTALRAGKDSLGRELVYRTDRELLASRVEVAQVSALRAEIHATGVREAARRHRVSGTRRDAFMEMMKLALGQPDPGDPLPAPLYAGVPPAKEPVSFDTLLDADKVVQSVVDELGMPRLDDFRELMALRRRREQNDARDWAQVDAYLQKIAQARGAKLGPLPSPPNFAARLKDALGLAAPAFDRLYDGLSEVKSIERVYQTYEKRADVQKFITGTLRLSLEDFAALMRIKTAMDGDWRKIDRLLEEAGRRKRSDAGYTLGEARASRNFQDKLARAVAEVEPKFAFAGGVDALFEAFLAIERYFYMPAESFHYLMSVAVEAEKSRARREDRRWEKVYAVVEAAHRDMIHARRRAKLAAIAQADPAARLADMLAAVLGARLEMAEAKRQLGGLGLSPDQLRVLDAVAAKTEPAPDWPRIVRMLEAAQCKREGFAEPVPRKVEWRNLYPAAEARAAPRWKTFGAGEVPRKPAPVPAPVLGWAATSPLLALAEGSRTVELKLGFAAGEAFRIDADMVRVELSTAKGWIEPQTLSFSWDNPGLDDPAAAGDPRAPKLRTLVLALGLSESQPALTPLTRKVHGLDTPSPVLRVMLKPAWREDGKCYGLPTYPALRKLSLARLRLTVAAAGLARLQLANDQGTLDAKKPFEPFGAQPAAGARFYVGHPEIVGKKIDTLTFNITWMGAPANLAEHYRNYPVKLDNTSFEAKVSLSDGRVLKDFSPALRLFDPANTVRAASALGAPADQGNPAAATFPSGDVTEWNRYVVCELLAPDFQHPAYPALALEKSLRMAALGRLDPTVAAAAAYQVNPPYAPKVKSLTLDYRAFAEDVRVFHVHPFGYRQLALPDTFLPQLDFEGELYIGLRNVAAPQNVALLFQVAEGTANPDLEPEPVRWWYLSGNEWRDLGKEGGVLADATRGLINSGIVELALRPVQPSTLLPGDLYWLRATIARAPESVCEMVDIHPNAVPATFADADNAADHLAEPLPAGSIRALAVPIAGVAGVRQPYSSFGGKMAEQDTSFYVRVSERLRHKERALAAWDYERLVLEKFPQIYKVKCLHADGGEAERRPGLIELVVIPDIRNRLPFNPFEPKAPADLIRDIEAFLRTRTPPFATVQVRNAHYVPVKVRCGVRFVPGQDEGYCRRRLNEELNRFLSPWAYEEGRDLVIGGSVYANSIINFIDARDYVDYIFEFKLFASQDGGANFDPVEPVAEGYGVSAEGRDGVLVAAQTHEFFVTTAADYRADGFTGLEYMQIGLDFIVS